MSEVRNRYNFSFISYLHLHSRGSNGNFSWVDFVVGVIIETKNNISMTIYRHTTCSFGASVEPSKP